MEYNIKYGCEIWTVDYRLKENAVKFKKKLKMSCKNVEILKIRDEELEEYGSNADSLGRIGSSVLNVTAMYCV